MSILGLLEAGSAKDVPNPENATLGTVPSQMADGTLYLRIVLLLQQLIVTVRAGLMSTEAASRG
ncbi:MAG: hypothetical protein JF625_27560 [Inquilinus limosus]|uniref:Uncharacterized protein n=1 Tax=Inquilinus limosus TaxID=171674 RepID=A0A952FPH6_9PROT|nr:hypothetical protein [Inquilinus limosus]